ncbi:hypothetical protein E2C01_003265 [Portunus trituberculatus]|uniref:Uncharacterized protein n=1 Tax=Portunus trituberculatus TaxID=210409 RepID=A0A5B7CNG3_PORTR|nr:hypothetical protein [Portunus trituberculatus]
MERAWNETTLSDKGSVCRGELSRMGQGRVTTTKFRHIISSSLPPYQSLNPWTSGALLVVGPGGEGDYCVVGTVVEER